MVRAAVRVVAHAVVRAALRAAVVPGAALAPQTAARHAAESRPHDGPHCCRCRGATTGRSTRPHPHPRRRRRRPPGHAAVEVRAEVHPSPGAARAAAARAAAARAAHAHRVLYTRCRPELLTKGLPSPPTTGGRGLGLGPHLGQLAIHERRILLRPVLARPLPTSVARPVRGAHLFLLPPLPLRSFSPCTTIALSPDMPQHALRTFRVEGQVHGQVAKTGNSFRVEGQG